MIALESETLQPIELLNGADASGDAATLTVSAIRLPDVPPEPSELPHALGSVTTRPRASVVAESVRMRAEALMVLPWGALRGRA